MSNSGHQRFHIYILPIDVALYYVKRYYYLVMEESIFDGGLKIYDMDENLGPQKCLTIR
jgi:hypothetical protein